MFRTGEEENRHSSITIQASRALQLLLPTIREEKVIHASYRGGRKYLVVVF